MSDVTGSSHLQRPNFYGPAERVLIEIWLSEITGRMLNGYPEGPTAIVVDAIPALSYTANVPVYTPAAPARVPAAAPAAVPAPVPVHANVQVLPRRRRLVTNPALRAARAA